VTPVRSRHGSAEHDAEFASTRAGEFAKEATPAWHELVDIRNKANEDAACRGHAIAHLTEDQECLPFGRPPQDRLRNLLRIAAGELSSVGSGRDAGDAVRDQRRVRSPSSHLTLRGHLETRTIIRRMAPIAIHFARPPSSKKTKRSSARSRQPGRLMLLLAGSALLWLGLRGVVFQGRRSGARSLWSRSFIGSIAGFVVRAVAGEPWGSIGVALLAMCGCALVLIGCGNLLRRQVLVGGR